MYPTIEGIYGGVSFERSVLLIPGETHERGTEILRYRAPQSLSCNEENTRQMSLVYVTVEMNKEGKDTRTESTQVNHDH